MKKTKFILHILAITLVLIFASSFANNKVMAAGNVGFRLTKNVSGKVTPGKQVTVYARINADNIESFQGTLVYSKELTLVSYQWSDDFNMSTKNFNPMDGRTENSFKGNKILSFAVASGDSKISGDKVVVAMTFDTTLCERGSQYKIVWNTDASKMIGNRTYIFSEGKNVSLAETTGVVIETTGTAPAKNGSSEISNNVSDLPGAVAELIEPTVNTQSGIDQELEEKIRTAEEATKNAKGESQTEQQGNNGNVQKPTNTNGGNGTNTQTQQESTQVQNSTENKSDKSTEKIPQLGGEAVIYCIGGSIGLLLIILSFIEIKKMKKI